MGAQYQVIAECAHVPVVDHSGVKATHLLYKGAFVPGEIDPARLKFLIDGGFVAVAGEEPIAPNASVKQDPGLGLDSVTVDGLRGQPTVPPSGSNSDVSRTVADAVRSESGIDKAAESPREASDAGEVDAKRAAAKAKLPEDGSVPDGRASKEVWAEWLAQRGYSYDELTKSDKAELVEMAKKA